MSKEIVWVMGYFDNELRYNIGGIYDCEEKALNACFNQRCGIGPLELNKTYPKDATAWEGYYYPSSENN